MMHYITSPCRRQAIRSLLDRILGWEPHTRLSDGTRAGILEAAAQCSYEKAGESTCHRWPAWEAAQRRKK